MKIVTIVGARPQFIKAAAVSNVIRKDFNEVLVHTGQHYDENMSKIFFDELNIPKPDYNLGVGSASHAKQTGMMLMQLEDIYLKERPDLIIVYGDTNSTLAGALCASKMLIPVAHIEAGLRSFNMAMPEEQNRILSDHISKYLFVPTETAEENLHNEGIIKNVYNVGDVMYDAILNFSKIADSKSDIMEKLNLTSKNFVLATIHRAENTNDVNKLSNIIKALNLSGKNIILPLHPRTRKYIKDYNIKIGSNISVIEPVGYLEMISLEMHCDKIVTDSGGVQKEAFFMSKPCITMREQTEWVETVKNGWNIIVGTDTNKIVDGIQNFKPTAEKKDIFGDGHSAEKIVDIIKKLVADRRLKWKNIMLKK